MNTLDDVCTITCAKCGEAAPFYQWRETPISGPLPDGEYQCPHCRTAFERRHVPRARWPHKTVQLVPIASRL